MHENQKDSYKIRISRALNFIEENLDKKMTLDCIAQEACYSKYHFSRIFAIITKETVGEYVRKRRVSESANELILTQKSIIDIAEKYQFESQQAFTRAFRSIFGISPGKYRKKEHRLIPFDQYTLSPFDIEQLQNNYITMEPEITITDEKMLVGLHINTSLANDGTVQMWKTFMPRRHEIKNNKDSGFFSVQVYNENITLETFTEDIVFEKWGCCRDNRS